MHSRSNHGTRCRRDRRILHCLAKGCWSRARNDLRAWTMGFAHAKGLISGLTRRPDPCPDFHVLPIFGCILVDSARCQSVSTTHALDHRRWVWKGGSNLKGGSAPCSVVLLTRAHCCGVIAIRRPTECLPKQDFTDKNLLCGRSPNNVQSAVSEDKVESNKVIGYLYSLRHWGNRGQLHRSSTTRATN